MVQVKKRKSACRMATPHNRQEHETHPKGWVLLVDDEELVTEVGQEMLACLGYATVVQTSSHDALEVFREAPQRFRLVMTDLNMPGMNGELLASHLWGIRPDIPIILCTGSNEMTQRKAQLRGFDALLTKPFVVKDVAQAIEHALTQRTAQKM